MSHISLENRVVLITGAGRGLGRAHALELASRGAAIVADDIDATAANAVVAEIEAAGGRAAACTHTVATPEGGRATVEAAVSAFGRLDAIVHNAGTWRNVPIGEMTPQQLDPVLDVHLRGAFFLVVPAWQIFVEQGYGRIVLTSSSAGAFGREAGSNYVAAKAALLGLGRALALEGTAHGIQVNCLLPMADTTPSSRPLPPAVRQRLDGALSSMRHLRQPERVSPLVTLLVSDECPVSGEAFSAAAGRFARVFIGVTEGWVKRGEPPTAEELLANFDRIEDRSNFAVPESVFDEFDAIAASLNRQVP